MKFPENIGHFTLNWKNWICLNEGAYVVFISISIFCDKSVNILPKIDLKILSEMNKL